MEDFDGTKLRIDEALKDREKGEARIGRTKTKESDSSVPVPPDLSREITAWIAAHPERTDPRAFLFPNRRETPYSVGNYLKRHLKPLAERVGIHDLTHQAFRRTSSTHIQDYASVKDLQGHLRHTNPQTTETLHESDPREPARCGCGSRREHRRRGERVQTTQVERSLKGSIDRQQSGGKAALTAYLNRKGSADATLLPMLRKHSRSCWALSRPSR
jgi:integrase-like protein